MSSPHWAAFRARKHRRMTGPHNMQTIKRLPWPYCRNCKILALNNDVTRRILKKPCTWLEDDGWAD